MGRDCVAAMNGAVEAGVDLAAPVFRRCLDEAFSQRQAGIVDQDVEAAEVLDDCLHHRLHGGKIGHVGPIGFRLSAFGHDLANQRLHIIARASEVDGKDCPFGGKIERNLAADAAGSTGHQRNLSVQSEVHVRLSGHCRLMRSLEQVKQTFRRYRQLLDFDF